MINIRNYQAVIFDMDGVLIDSEPLWKISMDEAFQKVGCSLTRRDFQKTVGLRIDEVIAYWYNEVGWETKSPKDVEELIIVRLMELIEENGTPLLGVIETLHYLKEQGIKIGLATSSYSRLIDKVLSTLEIEDLFDVTHSAENEKFGKPHPEVYLTTAKQLKVDPTRCLVVEDSLNGIISGKAARMKVVCIPEKTHTPEPKLSLADYMFDDMKEMLTSMKN